MHRGPAALHGCKVKIWCGKNRGPTWDYDRCYVRILDATTSAVLHWNLTTLQAVSRFIPELSEKIVQGKGHNPFKMMLAGV